MARRLLVLSRPASRGHVPLLVLSGLLLMLRLRLRVLMLLLIRLLVRTLLTLRRLLGRMARLLLLLRPSRGGPV